jgi:phosphoribosylamine-glycine ligase
MAKVLILSKQANGVPIALRLADEGHNVDMYIQDKQYAGTLAGYKNPKVVTKIALRDAYDLYIADMVGLGTTCDDLVRAGKLVVGGGVFNDKLELDREYGAKVITKLTDVAEPDSTKITTKEQLIKTLENSAVPKVIKPLGNKPVSLTLVSEDDANRSLLSTALKWGDKLVPCVLQDVIRGTEISTEGWFNGERFILPFNHTFERKRLMEGDKGPNTGCMGNVVYMSKGDRLTDMVLKPLEPLLRKVKYCGPIDVNCILKGSKAYFLEFTARLGYDAIQTLAELLRIPLYDFLYHIATRQGDIEEYYNEPAIGVRLTLPPYPTIKGAEEAVAKWKGIQVLDLEEGARRHTWLMDVIKSNDIEQAGGIDGVVGCVTARGVTIRECQRRVYRTVNNIVINKDVQYREDIGDDAIASKDAFDRWCDVAS